MANNSIGSISKFLTAVHNLQGTIYVRHDDGTYFYHCHAQPSGAPVVADAKWLVWREHKTSGELTLPVDGSSNVVLGFSNAVGSVTALTYHAPGTPA